MDLNSLQYFYEVSKDLHITNTARRLYISQQRLSGHIQRLEKYYGVKLIERDPKPHLTRAGHFLAKYAEQILHLERELQSHFLDVSHENQGVLRLGISSMRALVCIPEIMTIFQKSYPAVRFMLINGMTAQFYEKLMADEIDLFVGLGSPPYDGLSIVPLMSDQLYMMVSDQILSEVFKEDLTSLKVRLSQGVRLKDFYTQPFILPAVGNNVRRLLDNIFLREGIYPQIVCESLSFQLMARLSQLGVGIAFLPQILIKELFDLKSFCSNRQINLFPLDYAEARHQIFLASRVQHYTPRYISCFYDAAVKVFSTYEKLPDLLNSQSNF